MPQQLYYRTDTSQPGTFPRPKLITSIGPDREGSVHLDLAPLLSAVARLGIGRCCYFDPLGTLGEIKLFGFWGEYSMVARLKLEEVDVRAPPGVKPFVSYSTSVHHSAGRKRRV